MTVGECDAIVQVGSDGRDVRTRCGAPIPRESCPFPERVVEGRCERKVDVWVGGEAVHGAHVVANDWMRK